MALSDLTPEDISLIKDCIKAKVAFYHSQTCAPLKGQTKEDFKNSREWVVRFAKRVQEIVDKLP